MSESPGKSNIDSANFVISIAYTYTFANALYGLFEVDGKIQIENPDVIEWTSWLGAIVCIIMTFRFFFGNNNFIEDLFSSTSHHYVKLFHFGTVIIQSILLLGCSYLVDSPKSLFNLLALLFVIEVVWYCITYVIDRSSVSGENGLDQDLILSELGNGIFGLGLFLMWIFDVGTTTTIMVGGYLFLLNTAIDFKVNMPDYMHR